MGEGEGEGEGKGEGEGEREGDGEGKGEGVILLTNSLHIFSLSTKEKLQHQINLLLNKPHS